VFQRDSQRSKVYKAERLAWSIYDAEALCPLTLPECQKIANSVAQSMTRRRKGVFGCTVVNIGVHFIGGPGWGRRAVAKHNWNGRVINLPVWGRTKGIVCHELAHHVAGLNHGHDGRFVSAFIQLTRRFLGPTEADILRLAFLEARVKTRKVKV